MTCIVKSCRGISDVDKHALRTRRRIRKKLTISSLLQHIVRHAHEFYVVTQCFILKAINYRKKNVWEQFITTIACITLQRSLRTLNWNPYKMLFDNIHNQTQTYAHTCSTIEMIKKETFRNYGGKFYWKRKW